MISFSSFSKRPGATAAGIFSLALSSVLLLCGAGLTPTGGLQKSDINANGFNLTNAATVSATNVIVSGSFTAPTSFTLPYARITGPPTLGSLAGLSPTGTASSSTYLRGDDTWTTFPPAYTLPNATTSTLGGVRVGSGLSVSSGTISANYGTTSGTVLQGNAIGATVEAWSASLDALAGATIDPTALSAFQQAVNTDDGLLQLGTGGVDPTVISAIAYVTNSNNGLIQLPPSGNNLDLSSAGLSSLILSGTTAFTCGQINADNGSWSSNGSGKLSVTGLVLTPGTGCVIGNTYATVIDASGNIYLTNALYDSISSTGSDGQILTNSGGYPFWANILPGGLGFADGVVSIGDDSGTYYLDSAGNVSAATLRAGGHLIADSNGIYCSNVAPASSSATGTAGQIAYDSNFLYVCVAANTWKRIALGTF